MHPKQKDRAATWQTMLAYAIERTRAHVKKVALARSATDADEEPPKRTRMNVRPHRRFVKETT